MEKTTPGSAEQREAALERGCSAPPLRPVSFFASDRTSNTPQPLDSTVWPEDAVSSLELTATGFPSPRPFTGEERKPSAREEDPASPRAAAATSLSAGPCALEMDSTQRVDSSERRAALQRAPAPTAPRLLWQVGRTTAVSSERGCSLAPAAVSVRLGWTASFRAECDQEGFALGRSLQHFGDDLPAAGTIAGTFAARALKPGL